MNERQRMDLDLEEHAFVARLAEHYAPSEMTPARRVAFDERLAARLARRSRWRVAVPAMAAVAAAVLVWLAVPWSSGPTVPATPEVAAVATNGEAATVFAAYDWFTSAAPVDASDLGEGDYLPDDYVAISEFFL
jgi:anti-sigma-K factor RskA